jgi:hypothetical protein
MLQIFKTCTVFGFILTTLLACGASKQWHQVEPNRAVDSSVDTLVKSRTVRARGKKARADTYQVDRKKLFTIYYKQMPFGQMDVSKKYNQKPKWYDANRYLYDKNGNLIGYSYIIGLVQIP